MFEAFASKDSIPIIHIYKEKSNKFFVNRQLINKCGKIHPLITVDFFSESKMKNDRRFRAGRFCSRNYFSSLFTNDLMKS